MAERLLAGDSLYVDVWDNKDPLFFYMQAIAVWIHPVFANVLDIVWIILACVAVYNLARSVGLSVNRAVLVGGGATVLIVAGTTYFGGMTHLPATAVGLWVLVLLLRRRGMIAGILIAATVFLKFTSAPVVGLMALVLLLALRDWRSLRRAIIGGVLGGLAMLGVLLLRGEFIGYLRTIRMNIAYSGTEFQPGIIGFLEHLQRVFGTGAHGVGTIVTLVLSVVMLIVAKELQASSRSMSRALWLAAAWGIAGSLLVSGLTGVQLHHGQLFYLPALVALACFLGHWEPTGLGGVKWAVVVLLLGYLLGGAIHPTRVIDAWHHGWERVIGWQGDSPEAVAMKAYASTGTYVRIGGWDVNAHARGSATGSLHARNSCITGRTCPRS